MGDTLIPKNIKQNAKKQPSAIIQVRALDFSLFVMAIIPACATFTLKLAEQGGQIRVDDG
jgi:hypothetical protein